MNIAFIHIILLKNSKRCGILRTEGATIGAFSGMLGGKGSVSKHVSNHFWRMLGSGADDLTYYFSQIGHQAVRDGLKAIPGIIKSTIPSVTKSFMKISCH